MKHRLRYAPSPTGTQHIGGMRTLLFNYLFARHNKGNIVLRIEDTDTSRSKQEYIDDILACAKALSISFDELLQDGPYAPYIQSQRTDIYQHHCQKLLDLDKAYYCYTSQNRQYEDSDVRLGYDRSSRDLSKDEIKRYQEEYRKKNMRPVVRLKMPLEGNCILHDGIVETVQWNYKDVSPDPILLKQDGMPTYHLANVVDDHLMNITDVFRSQEWLSSSPIHLFLYSAFEWTPPKYYHLPLVLGEDGKKLSKRYGAMGVHELLKKGYLPQTLINAIALLGWSYDERSEFFTMEHLIRLFDVSAISKSPAVFNMKKLDWFNQHYIQEMERGALALLIREQCEQQYGKSFIGSSWAQDEKFLQSCAELVRSRIHTVQEISPLLDFFFKIPNIEHSIDMFQEKFSRNLVKMQYKGINDIVSSLLPECAVTDYEEVLAYAKRVETELRRFCQERQCSFGKVLMSLRIVLTGSSNTPPILPILVLLGKKRVKDTINKTKDYIDAL